MAKDLERQVIILGGGCAGLWLLYELCREGYSALLIDHNQLGQFASTANQSWLHTGAVYAVTKDALDDKRIIDIVGRCREANEISRKFCDQYCPDAIFKGSESLFLFATSAEAKIAHENVKRLGLASEVVSESEIRRMEPILSPMTYLEGGLLTQDIAFNSHSILSALARKAWECGGLFHNTGKDLTSLHTSFNRATGMWSITDGKLVFKARYIVCAGGALIPRMLRKRTQKTRSSQKIPRLQKCLVAVLNKKICHRIISIRSAQSQFLSLVPFESGTTINAGSLDAPASDFADRSFRNPKRIYRELGERITEFMPGMVNTDASGAHFYVCQKVTNIDSSSHPRHYFWIKEPSSDFYYFYPGKFTLAPVAAREFTKALAANLTKTTVSYKRGTGVFVSNVAMRPYWDQPSHIGYTQNEMFVFDEIGG